MTNRYGNYINLKKKVWTVTSKKVKLMILYNLLYKPIATFDVFKW